MVIVIDKDKSMKLNQDPIEVAKLQASAGGGLQDPRRARGVRQGRSGLEFETVAHAIDIAKGAGIDKIGLMTPKIEAGQ